jgi:hypothetical protein
MKTLRKTRLATWMVAGSLLGPAWAAAEDIVGTAPPEPRIEHEPPHRDGYVWAPGYWDWNGHAFRWESGTWVPERRRGHWVADHWEQDGSQWHHVRGHWQE